MKKIISVILAVMLALSLFAAPLQAAQYPINVPDGTGAQVRAGFNNAILTVGTLFEGPAAPNPTYAGMLWADTGTNTIWQRNQTNAGWVMIGTLDSTNWGLVPWSSVSSTPSANIIPQANSSGLLPFSITGNAATATSASNASTVGGYTAAQLLTSAGDAGHLFDSIGYQKLGSGLVIQWGVTTRNNSPQTINFNIPFPSFCAGVWVSNNGSMVGYALSDITTTSFSVSSTVPNGFQYYWVAIGW